MKSGIYRIEMGNGYFYIGSSVNLSNRRGCHLRNLERMEHRNIRMQHCWSKYGIFEFVVLEKCEVECLLSREQEWIDKNFADPKNLNIAPTAGSCLGRVLSPETRAKISSGNKGKVRSSDAKKKYSIARKGKKASSVALVNMSKAQKGRKGFSPTPETRAKLSAANKGKTGYRHTAESLRKMSESQKGKKLSPETRKKISAAQKGRTFSSEHRAKLSAAQEGMKRSQPSIETRRKISESLKAHHRNRSSNHTPGARSRD